MVESIKKCGVVVNKSIFPEGAAKCFDFVQEADANPRRRILTYCARRAYRLISRRNLY